MLGNPPSYSVKYLGIVDGAMGILSRKMAMQSNLKFDKSVLHPTKTLANIPRAMNRDATS